MENILTLITCHAVGDYLFQTDYMAREKGKDLYILFIHCIVYCAPFMMVFGVDRRILLLFITHWICDYVKCRGLINITVDQIFHYVVLLILYMFGVGA